MWSRQLQHRFQVKFLLLMQDFLSWKILNSLYYNINHAADVKLGLKAGFQISI